VTAQAKYTAIAIVFAVSLAAVVLFHSFQMTVVSELAGIPAVAALFGALFQLGRDSIAFERSMRLEEEKNRFSIGATSHMANVVFDKHVEYCERYIAEVFETLTNLFRHGPHEDALKHASSLYLIRRAWSVWLTPEIESELEQFEASIRRIGANAHLVAMVPGEPTAIKAMYAEFAAVFGAKYGFKQWDGEDVPQDHAIEAVIAHLRSVLGIDELTRLRSELIRRATEDLTRSA